MSRNFYNNGDSVEVTRPGRSSTGPYYPATVLRSPAKTKTQILVEYRALTPPGRNSGNLLREFVCLDNVRPALPRQLNHCFKFGDDVDAYWLGGWNRGKVVDVYENSRYLVLVEDGRGREFTFQLFDLRVHRDWVDGSWFPPLEDQAYLPRTEVKDRPIKLTFKLGMKNSEAKFGSGTMVEVTSEEEGYKKSWFLAKIISRIGRDKFVVEYQDLLTEDRTRLLREEADERHIRPVPPSVLSSLGYKRLQKVDARYNDGWWEGVIWKVNGLQHVVYFSSTDEELEFEASDLRPHQDWINGKWIIAEECSSKCIGNSHGVNSKPEETKINFTEGMMVEVRSDEEGYRGSWYTAYIVDLLQKGKFLVQYKTLLTEKETDYLKEVADEKNIRPYPPELQHDRPYSLGELVDAWHNEGWWVGEISRYSDGSKYVVYFWTSDEELVFEHRCLRPHLEWIDGKWEKDKL
ncbi:hypothetical protein UlMin_009186, partial [Ulmus minor]